MNYYVARNGQTYGPYSEETVRKYLTDGSMQASDMGRTDAMPNWAPLSQILSIGAASTSSPFAPPPPAYAGQPQPVMGQSGAGLNVPPSLHWAIILVIAVFTSGLFITIWAFIQANWIRSIDPASKAIRDLIIGSVFPILGAIAAGIFLVATGVATGLAWQLDNPSLAVLGSMASGFLIMIMLGIVGLIFTLKCFFGMKASMERYYNSTEPINLRLSGVMTLFFNVFYLQYHMTRIADWKRTGVLQP